MAVLNPRVDFAFKKLFGSEEHKTILIAFINAVIAPEIEIKTVTLLNPLNHKDSPAEKSSILDIKATDESGRQYNVEMQITDQVYYNQRALYYWSKLYTSQLREGAGFDTLNKTISINVLNFNYFGDETEYHNVFRILNVRSHRSYFEDLELHFIELKKFDKDLQHLQTALDRWITFLQKAERYNRDTLPTVLKQDPVIGEAMQALETLYLNDMEREIYEARLKWLRDEMATLQKAELKGLARGEAKGMEKGLKKGIEQGIEQGIGKGIEQVARNMLKQGFPMDTIVEVTGLSIDAIQALKE